MKYCKTGKGKTAGYTGVYRDGRYLGELMEAHAGHVLTRVQGMAECVTPTIGQAFRLIVREWGY